MKRSAEVQRVLEKYRRLILLGHVSLPLEQARRLLGPDRAYHLYFRGARGARPARRRRGRRSRS